MSYTLDGYYLADDVIALPDFLATTRQNVERFIRELDANPRTKRTYRHALQKYLECGIRLNNDVLVRFNTSMLAGDLSHSTRNTYRAALRRFLRWLDVRCLLPDGCTLSLIDSRYRESQTARSHPHVPRVPDPRLGRLLEHYRPQIDDTTARRREMLRNAAIVEVLFSTACRVAELVSLNRKQVRDGTAPECVIVGKGGKARTIYLSPQARAAIRAYLLIRDDDNPALFVTVHRARRITTSTAQAVIHDAGVALGLAPGTSPHSIRHFVATDMLRSGVPIEIVQTVLGHASINTTRQFYAHLSDDDTRATVLRYQLKKSR